MIRSASARLVAKGAITSTGPATAVVAAPSPVSIGAAAGASVACAAASTIGGRVSPIAAASLPAMTCALGVGHQDRLQLTQIGAEVAQCAFLQLRPLDVQTGGDAGIQHPAGLGHQHLQAGLDRALQLTVEQMIGDDSGGKRRAQHGDDECREELQPNAATAHQTNSAIESMESGG